VVVAWMRRGADKEVSDDEK
jgi:hypothetical protein